MLGRCVGQSSWVYTPENMLAIDTNQLGLEQVTTPAYLLSLAGDNTQLLINSIWHGRWRQKGWVEDAVIAKFPPPT